MAADQYFGTAEPNNIRLLLAAFFGTRCLKHSKMEP